jgi:hypothetical protein
MLRRRVLPGIDSPRWTQGNDRLRRSKGGGFDLLSLKICGPALCLCLASLAGPARAATLRLDARTLFDRAVTRDIRLSKDGLSLLLNSGELYEDDGPAAGHSYKPNTEKLSPTVWVRKQLVIADPRASAAILALGPGGKLKVTVNGRPQTLEPPGSVDEWQTYAINPAALKPGLNDIVISGSGEVWLSRSDDSYVEFPHRSARSSDAGANWMTDRLGPNGDISGEYNVRIFLEHYLASGSIRLPVMDVANLSGSSLSPPLRRPGPVRISVDAEKGDSQSVSVRVRSGTSYVPGKGSWSDWAPLDASGILRSPRGRFLEVELTLATRDPLDTPRLRNLTIETEPVPAADWTKDVRVVDAHNEEIIRTAIPFRYEPFTHPRLKELRARYHLDDVARNAKTELELITTLARWAAHQWKFGDWHLEQFYPAWDALEILKKAPDGRTVGGFCHQFDLVFLQACESFGIPGRGISVSHGGLDRPQVGGHEPTEVWSNQYRKWVYADGTSAWYAVDRATDVPLSLWELRRRQIHAVRNEPYDPVRILELEVGLQKWRWRSLREDLGLGELRMIPRSNFLEQKWPLPLNQGMGRSWPWDGHYVWTDDDVPADVIHGTRVTQKNNFEWTLNQAHYVLEADSKRGEVTVHLDTETPGFETFLAEIDGAASQRVSAIFAWKLHPGRNRLKVWPRNDGGRDGIASWIELEMPAK